MKLAITIYLQIQQTMKKHLLHLMLGLLVACAATACESDDDGYKAPEAVQKALLARYPDATRIGWKQQNGYEKADFERPDTQLPGGYSDCTAWFDGSGDWHMTESEIAFATLPQAVRDAFAASEYASWHIDEVERIERKGLETLYNIEIEGRSATGAETDVELYYTADGILVRTVVDRDDDEMLLPEALPEAVRSYIDANYPNARIVEIDRDRTLGLLEVEILDGRTERELYFAGSEWVRTVTDMQPADLPAAVREAIAASEYASWTIDDVDFVEEPTRSYWRVEVESGGREVRLAYDAAGNPVKQ